MLINPKICIKILKYFFKNIETGKRGRGKYQIMSRSNLKFFPANFTPTQKGEGAGRVSKGCKKG